MEPHATQTDCAQACRDAHDQAVVVLWPVPVARGCHGRDGAEALILKIKRVERDEEREDPLEHEQPL